MTAALAAGHRAIAETHHHFKCGYCKQWWSIGNFPLIELKKATCPWCGKEDEVYFHGTGGAAEKGYHASSDK